MRVPNPKRSFTSENSAAIIDEVMPEECSDEQTRTYALLALAIDLHRSVEIVEWKFRKESIQELKHDE